MASIGSLGSLNLLAQAAAAVPAESSNPLRPLNGKRPAEHPAESASESKNTKKELAERVSKLEKKIEESLEIQKRILALLERSPALPPQLPPPPPAFSDDVLMNEGFELMNEGIAKKFRNVPDIEKALNSQKMQECFQRAFDIFANVNPQHPKFHVVQRHMATCKFQLSLQETNLEKKQKLQDEAVKLNRGVATFIPNYKPSAQALPPQLPPPPAFSDDVLMNEGMELMKEGMAKRSQSVNSQKIQKCFQKAFDIFSNVNPLHPQFQAVQKHMASCKCQLSLLETNLEKKQKLFDEAVKLNPLLPPAPPKSDHTWMTEGMQRVTSGTKFLMDKPQKSQRCFQEAFEMFANVSPQYAQFKTAQMQMGSCKYQLSLLEANPEEKQKLRDEAVKFFPALANTIPNYKPSAPSLPPAPKSADDWIKEGHDKRLLAMAAKKPQEKQKLIQEAFDSYSKVGPNHPRAKSAQYELAGCKVALAQEEANPQERQKLIDEAEKLWPGIVRKPPAPK